MGDTSLRLHKCLKKNFALKGSTLTHTSLGKPRGSFFIPLEYQDDFFKYYCEALDNNEDLYITEVNRHISPVKIDLDFRFNLDDKSKHIKIKDIEDIVNVYTCLLLEFFEVHDFSKLTCYVMEKKTNKISNNEVKDGIHIMFPKIVSKASVQYLIREEAIDRLKPIFERMNCINSCENIIDDAIIERNNWLMYGSKKPNNEPYLLTKIYNITKDENEDIKLNKIIPSKETKPSEFVRVLSIRNKFEETKINLKKIEKVNEFEFQQEERQRKMEISKNIISEKTNNAKNFSSVKDLEQVGLLVNECLDSKRADEYATWIRLGWCLRNIDYRLEEVWENFSKRSNKYIEGECKKYWNRMRDDGLGLGTLHMWAKNDNLSKYNEIVQAELKKLIFASRTLTHTDVAKVVHYLYRHKFVCTSHKFKTWFEFRDHSWKQVNSGSTLRQKISEEVWCEYMKASLDWTQRALETTDQEDQKRYQENSKKLNEAALRLKNVPYKDNVMKECMELFYDEKFEEKLDNYDHLIGFPNGVYDLDIGEFREGRPEDYISLQTNVDYIPYDPCHPCINDIKNYLSQVFIKEDVREYVCKLFASFLHGSIKDQKFHIWTGNGSNSKSKLVELFMETFGTYCCIFPITLLTQKRNASNAASTELARAKGKRFALMSEPSEDEQLNIGLMKELTGGDKIMARPIYKEPIEFVPKFKQVVLCNTIPKINSDDDGTWRRVRVVEFCSKFVEFPQAENEFPLDINFGNNIHIWRPYFMSLLLEYFKIYKKEGIQEPADVTKCTDEYKQDNDHLTAFIQQCIRKKDGSFLSLNEVFTELKQWVKDENNPMKIPTKSELCKHLSRKLGKSINNNNSTGFYGYQLYSQNSIVEDDD